MQPLYKLFFNPYFDFTAKNVRAEHATTLVEDKGIATEVRSLVKSIAEHGLRNPLFVTVYDSFMTVHPGKCRVKALKLLGHDTAPALLYVPSGVSRIPLGATPIEPDAATLLFGTDVRCEYDERWFAVKRVSRPGR